MGTRAKLKKQTRGDRNIEWIESYCYIPEGKHAGQKVKLTAHQKKWVKQIYDTPTRTFILSLARKNAKTAFTAFLLLLHLCGPEAIQNGQLYSAAQSRDQASILFGYASKCVRMSPDLSEYVLIRDTAKELLCQPLGTLYKALSADAATKYGLSPCFIVHDELGQVKSDRSELYDALETACAAHESPLTIIISTQAPSDSALLSQLIDRAQAEDNDDPGLKCVLYSAPVELDPFSDEAIRAANPHFDVFMNRDEVRGQAARAKRMPSAEAAYRNLILNQRVSQTSPFVPAAVWKKNAGEPDYEAFRHYPVYAGLDLSARNDLTALALTCRDEDKRWHVLMYFFAPEVGVADRAHRDRAPYDLWANEGVLTLTPGASVDYEIVARTLCELADDFDLCAVAYDRWRIDVFKKELERLGRELPMVPFGQGFASMSPALETLEAELVLERVLHGSNPCLNWCATNAIATRNPVGERKLDKSKATGRIDGMVALAMAFGAATTAAPEQKTYVIGSDYELLVV